MSPAQRGGRAPRGQVAPFWRTCRSPRQRRAAWSSLRGPLSNHPGPSTGSWSKAPGLGLWGRRGEGGGFHLSFLGSKKRGCFSPSPQVAF